MLSWSTLTLFLSDGTPWHFLQPQWLFLMAVAPMLALLSTLPFLRLRRTDWDVAAAMKSLLFRHPLIDKMDFESAPKSTSNLWRWLLHILRWGVIALIAIALANPVKEVPLPPEPQQKTVRDVVFVVESSASFMLTDYQMGGQPTSRMEVVKSVLDQFVSGLEGNRFSFIVYADEAFTLMPLTSDAMTARLMLKRLRPYLAGRSDEAMGEALGLALQQAESNTKTTQKRIVVLISDGLERDSRVPLDEAITYAQGLDLPIYTIGVGAGTANADKRQFSGLLYQPLENASLKRIASETGGQYYQIDSQDSLQKVLQKIDQTEGVVVETPTLKKAQIALYPYLIALAVMLFILYFALVQLLARKLQFKEGV